MNKSVTVRYSKGQMKIQEMAFVLIAIMVFFGIVALVFLVIRLSGLESEANLIKENEANEIVNRLATSPEFLFEGVCEDCLDFDKAMIIKERQTYKDFWNLDYLVIERVYPKFKDEECTKSNYPNCNKITIIDKEEYGVPSSSFVSVCRMDGEQVGYVKCELGKIYATERGSSNE